LVDPVKRYEQITKALPEVKELFDRGEKIIEELMQSTRYGMALNKRIIKDQSSKIMKIVQRDPQIALALLDLKNFDDYTYVHSINVAVLSITFAMHLRFSEEKIMSIAQGSILHDIGKAKIPIDILNKPDKLTESEMKIIKEHPALGVKVIQNDNINDEIVEEIIHFHHENFDGTGYPNQVQGIQTKRFASIVAVADYYDALTSKRVYKNEFDPHEAMKNIYGVSGVKFDPRVVNHFIRTLGIYPIGTIVELSDGRIASVIAFSPDNLLKPLVKALFYKSNLAKKSNEMINLADSKIFIKGIYKDKEIKTIDVFT
jgi:putative nucleotidyltransferase with HDIG domain